MSRPIIPRQPGQRLFEAKDARRMSAKELRSVLENLGVTQRGAAEAMDISERNMRRYVAGKLPVPLVIALLLRSRLEQLTGES